MATGQKRKGIFPDPRQRRHAGYALVIATLALFAGFKGILPVFRSHLMDYLGIGDGRLGILFGITALAGMAGTMVGGRMVDRWGPRRVIRLCLVGLGFGMVLIGIAGSVYWRFTSAVFLAGLFSPPLFIAVNAYLPRLFPRHQRRIISLNFASSTLSGMFFPLLAEGLLSLESRLEAFSFAHVLHGPFFLVGVSLLAASFIYRPNRKYVPPKQLRESREKENAGPWWKFSLPAQLRLPLFMMIMHGAADGMIFQWMPRFLESASFDFPLFPPGIALSGFSLAYLFSRVILSLLPDRAGRRLFVWLPGLAGGTLMIAAILSRDYYLTVFGYVLGAFCWSFEFPVLVSMVYRKTRSHFGSILALNGLGSGLMLFISSSLTGQLVERLGEVHFWKLMLAPASMFVFIGLCGLYWVFKVMSGLPGEKIE